MNSINTFSKISTQTGVLLFGTPGITSINNINSKEKGNVSVIMLVQWWIEMWKENNLTLESFGMCQEFPSNDQDIEHPEMKLKSEISKLMRS